MVGKTHTLAVALAATLVGISAPTAPAQASERPDSSGVTGVVADAAGDPGHAAQRATPVVTTARDVADGAVASTESATARTAGGLDQGAAPARDQLSGVAAEAGAAVRATADDVIGGGQSASDHESSPSQQPRPEGSGDSLAGSLRRDRQRDWETDARGPEGTGRADRAAFATASPNRRTTDRSHRAPAAEPRRSPSTPSPSTGASDPATRHAGQTVRRSSGTLRTEVDASGVGADLPAAKTASPPPSPTTPADSLPWPGAAVAPVPGSAAASASFLFAVLLVAGMVRPAGLRRRLPAFSASAGPLPFLSALERPG